MITIEEMNSGIAFTIQNKSHHGQTLDPSLIFKKYYRGTESLGSQGFGLGLYLATGLLTVWAAVFLSQPIMKQTAFAYGFRRTARSPKHHGGRR